MTISFQNHQLIRNYFLAPTRAEYTRWTVISAVAALSFILMFGGSGFTSFLGFVGTVAGLIWGVIPLVRRHVTTLPRATDQQVDAWLRERIGDIMREAHSKVHLDRDSVTAQSLAPIIGLPDPRNYLILMREGRDRRYRYSFYQIHLFFLTDWKIVSYSCVLDMFTGEIVQDAAKDLSMSKINSLDTFTDRIQSASRKDKHTKIGLVTLKGEMITVKGFSVTLSSGSGVGTITSLSAGGQQATVSYADPDATIRQLREYIWKHSHAPDDGAVDRTVEP
ncbi:hypothetical protein AB0F17_49610 [Nonomuraea sp. NPDC026600]|uniref:hypothetical protein n=1 Tax=Nonomuraea sp. NPDC026600 TaxID=3155363 RepID=UPI00340BA562